MQCKNWKLGLAIMIPHILQQTLRDCRAGDCSGLPSQAQDSSALWHLLLGEAFPTIQLLAAGIQQNGTRSVCSDFLGLSMGDQESGQFSCSSLCTTNSWAHLQGWALGCKHSISGAGAMALELLSLGRINSSLDIFPELTGLFQNPWSHIFLKDSIKRTILSIMDSEWHSTVSSHGKLLTWAFPM